MFTKKRVVVKLKVLSSTKSIICFVVIYLLIPSANPIIDWLHM